TSLPKLIGLQPPLGLIGQERRTAPIRLLLRHMPLKPLGRLYTETGERDCIFAYLHAGVGDRRCPLSTDTIRFLIPRALIRLLPVSPHDPRLQQSQTRKAIRVAYC